jgi:hypothetical protein
MRKYHFALIFLIGLACAPAKGTALFISLDTPTLAGAPGDLLQFFGTISNTTGATVFLNGDNFNLTGFPPSALDDSPFFANAPLSLGAGASTADIGLFNVTIPNPFVGGDYGGTFQILGGADGNAQDVVATAFFTVQVDTPEPSPAVLLSGALLFLLVAKRLLPGVLR